MKYRYLIPFLLLLTTQIEAKHIIGGVITYECLGGGTYQFTMTMYRDCSDVTGAGFDTFAPVSIYKGDEQIPINTDFVGPPVIESVDIDPNDNPCVTIPPNVCVEVGVYIWEYTFDEWPSNDVYTISYQRCCRNATITNIQTPDEVGATFTIDILPASQDVCNNSPTFDNFPPVLICAGEPLNFNHSATDSDSDQLIYEMCEPLTGGGQDGTVSNPGDPSSCTGVVPNPACPPPYVPVSYVNPPYTVVHPMGGDPLVTINSVTGFLEGTPEVQGQFVVGVCVNEFRNGELMSTIRRDFQFNVVNCDPQVQVDLDVSLVDTIFTVEQCGDLDVFINNMSFQEEFIDSFIWQFVLDTGIVFVDTWGPSLVFPEAGIYDGLLILNPGEDCNDTGYIEVRLYPEVVADFQFEYDTCVSGPVTFTDTSYHIDGMVDIVNYNWNFGDDATDTLANPMHEYDTPGDFSVSLSVVDENGCNDDITQTLSYRPVPAVIVVAPDDVEACPPAIITFNNLSTPVDSTYNITWSLGTGDTVQAISPTYQYQNAGVYDVSLEIISPINCQIDTVFPQLINIVEPPIADFSTDPTFATNIAPDVNFIDSSVDAVAWEWFVNDRLVSHDQNPIVSFPDTGWQSITLIVTRPEDCKDTITQLIDVVPLTFYHLPNAFTPNEDTTNDFWLGRGLLPGITNFQLTIWDRWGSVVFETDDPNVGWNGQINNTGKQAINGLYLYQISFTGPRGAPFEKKGSLTVLR